MKQSGHSFFMPRARVIFLLALAFPLAVQSRTQSSLGYVGASACAKCHTRVTHDWRASSHSKMLERATTEAVKGNFAPGEIVLRGSTYTLDRRNSDFFITESELAGKPWRHHIDYTLGSIRIQHYLATLPDGRIVVLPPTWDIRRKTWISALDDQNPEEGQAPEVWNKSCYSCHVSGAEKNYDAATNSYRTSWRDAAVDCETCHGPGSSHVGKETAIRAKPAAGTRTGGGAGKEARPVPQATADAAIVNPAKLDPTRSTMICAECHSFRDVYAVGFHPGANYNDFFVPVMEYRLPVSSDPAYWPDGRPRWLANEAFALWQSECFLKGGATCLACHKNSHDVDMERNPQLGPANNALCTACHASIGVDIPAHTHHAAKSEGSSCIECHMPVIVASLGAHMRDHSMSIPAPENTVRHQIPNACNLCHQDKPAEWALEHARAWWGQRSGQKMVDRADAFARARNGDAAAIPALLEILSDKAEGAFIRANAAGYLGNFPNDPSAYGAVLHSFSDPDPLVRETAALALKPRAALREAVAPELVGMLRDPVATVRVSAVIALVSMGVREVPPGDAPWFDRAKALYAARADLDSDDAQQQLAAGRFFSLAGDMGRAVTDFRASMKLDPTIRAEYYLALALSEQHDFQSARKILEAIPRDDPQYQAAQRLMAQIEAKEAQQSSPTAATSAAMQTTSEAEASFLNGQLEYQDGHYESALSSLDTALRLAPDASWATKAEIYRAICLEKLSRREEAEAAMRRVDGQPDARGDLDFELAYAELLDETGRASEALKRVDSLIAADSKAPSAYLWRAKLLVELNRPADAASAAEEAAGLDPNAPAAHNLLVRIYQMLGRTKEAAEQAAWLRNYERRAESR